MDSRKEESHLRNFYLRRLFRIGPLYYTAIMLYWSLSYIPPLNLNGPLSYSNDYTFFNLISNFLFIHSTVMAITILYLADGQ